MANNSKELWLSLIKDIDFRQVTLGDFTSYDYLNDPKHLVFVASRYKFCASLLQNVDTAIEIGCGDGFGSVIVADAVKKLICTDINEKMLLDNKQRNSFLINTDYLYHDFRKTVFNESVDAIYLLDVIEHIFIQEESALMENIVSSLKDNGILIIGTPNESAQQYASKNAKAQHINLKNHTELKSLCSKYFNNVFLFGMNDEVVHTGYLPMAHYLFALCIGPKKQ